MAAPDLSEEFHADDRIHGQWKYAQLEEMQDRFAKAMAKAHAHAEPPRAPRQQPILDLLR